MNRVIRRIARKILFPFDSMSYDLFFNTYGKTLSAQPLTVTPDNQRIVILSPHQDDELLGCGGFLLKNKDRHFIQIVYVNDGGGKPELRTPAARQRLIKIREQEATNVCRVMQINDPIFLNFTEDLHYDPNLVESIEEQLRNIRPDIILAPFLTDKHPHHIAISRALTSVDVNLVKELSLIFYQVHAQIPDRYLNAYIGLAGHEHAEKEKLLKIYESQDFNNSTTMKKYLLFSRKIPNEAKRYGLRSMERYSVMKYQELVATEKVINYDKLTKRIRGLNYSPYSFKNFVKNRATYGQCIG